jgi:hypothetical protein
MGKRRGVATDARRLEELLLVLLGLEGPAY